MIALIEKITNKEGKNHLKDEIPITKGIVSIVHPQAFLELVKKIQINKPIRMDMKKNNFSQDETVELSTRRGKVNVKVRFDKMIPDGMVFMPFCFENAPANLLTNQALDPDGKIPELKYCAAKIEKLTA